MVIINCARGALIDTEALIEGIESGRIGSVGVDCFEGEDDVIRVDHNYNSRVTNHDYIGSVDKVSVYTTSCTKNNMKKDAQQRHPRHFIILFRFNAVADKRQWYSAAPRPCLKKREYCAKPTR